MAKYKYVGDLDMTSIFSPKMDDGVIFFKEKPVDLSEHPHVLEQVKDNADFEEVKA